MAAILKPTKRQRRLGIKVIPKLDKYIARRPYPPGVHGTKRAAQLSDYGLQLQEKQRVKFIYGLREKQLRRLFNKDKKNFLSTLERRLDNVLFRAGLAQTRSQSRQLVSHGHVKINEKKVTVPSFITCPKDKIITAKPAAVKLSAAYVPDWLSVDPKSKMVTVKKIPSREEITSEINDQLIIEYYSR